MSTQHSKFLDRLGKSSASVFAVAEHLHANGASIEIPKVGYAPTASELDGYLDEGDIFIITKKRLEVKGLGVDFSGPGDWPFGDYALVSNKAAVERAGSSVSAYISVSKNLKNAAIIWLASKPFWFLVEKKASNTGNMEKYYACPLSHVEFVSLRGQRP